MKSPLFRPGRYSSIFFVVLSLCFAVLVPGSSSVRNGAQIAYGTFCIG
jgi:hypothetical protein